MIAGFLYWSMCSQHWSGLLGAHVLPDERSVFLVCPFDSLSPSGRAAAGIYQSWVWQSCGSHCPMQGGEGRLRRLLWRASELVSPQGKHAFKLWPAWFPHGTYVHPECSPCNSANAFWVVAVLFCFALVSLCFSRDLVFCHADPRQPRIVAENGMWQSHTREHQERVYSWIARKLLEILVQTSFSALSYLKSPPGAIFLPVHVLSAFVSPVTPQRRPLSRIKWPALKLSIISIGMFGSCVLEGGRDRQRLTQTDNPDFCSTQGCLHAWHISRTVIFIVWWFLLSHVHVFWTVGEEKKVGGARGAAYTYLSCLLQAG